MALGDLKPPFGFWQAGADLRDLHPTQQRILNCGVWLVDQSYYESKETGPCRLFYPNSSVTMPPPNYVVNKQIEEAYSLDLVRHYRTYRRAKAKRQAIDVAKFRRLYHALREGTYKSHDF